MQAPNAEQIETAADTINKVPSFVRASQTKELHSFGEVRAQALGVSGLSLDFVKGYELGLQTARIALAGSGLLVMKGVKADDLL